MPTPRSVGSQPQAEASNPSPYEPDRNHRLRFRHHALLFLASRDPDPFTELPPLLR
jgi:hypothetical protein